MTETVAARLEPETGVPPLLTTESWLRFGRYIVSKALVLFLTVTAGVYLTILVANLGGYIDQIYKGQISETIAGMLMGGWLDEIQDPEEKTRIVDQTVWAMEEGLGLHEPFLVRSGRFLWSGMTFGFAERIGITRGYSSVGTVRPQILQALPYTVLLFVTANVVVFIVCLFLALMLARRPGGWVDRSVIVLSALTSAPSWIHGTVLIVVLAAWLHWLPFPNDINLSFADVRDPNFLRFIARQMILPTLAIVTSVFFQTIYAWRTFFLIDAGEDYVEMAKAKGLPDRAVERNYILRPSLPFVLTNFSLMLTGLWQGAIALELLFRWPGIGLLFLKAARSFHISMMVGVVVLFAYLLALTVFVLDIVYALVDPRVTLTSRSAGAQDGRIARARRAFSWPRWQPIEFRIPRPSFTWRPRHAWQGLRASLNSLAPALAEVRRYPSALTGMALIMLVGALSIYTVITIPYDQAVHEWRAQGGDWLHNPRNARPVWVNLFRSSKLPETIVTDSREPGFERVTTKINETMQETIITLPFHFEAGEYPQDLVLNLFGTYTEKLPLVSLAWLRPDGTELDLGGFTITTSTAHYLLRDERLQRRLRGQPVMEALMGDPAAGGSKPLTGDYQLQVTGYTFEDGGGVEGEMVLYGQVAGMAGTDHRRRDLALALMWGAPVALAFGLLGAVGTNLAAMTLAATGVWLSGWVDGLIQRLTEVNMILPVLPVAIMVFFMYSKSVWIVLGVVVLLNIFGSTLKNYRAAFLQVKNAAYIEAAQTYGASSWRIIRTYLVPRILPVLAPQLVIMVPGYVFYEATLAYLGVSDPYLPTWGKVIYDALTNNALQYHAYWLIEPLALMMLTALAFALLGFAMDKILNPRLRNR